MTKEIRKNNKINLQERIKIEIYYCNNNKSMREIAKLLNRNVSSISREIGEKTRHGLNKYEASVSNNRSLIRRHKRKKKELLKSEYIREYVKKYLKLGWTPEQISGRMKIESNSVYSISHEAIYQYIYNTYKQEYLRIYLPLRRKRRMLHNYRKVRRIWNKDDKKRIEIRPKEVEDRVIFGHFEDDCVVSRITPNRLKTINERVSGVVFIEQMNNGTIEESNKAVIKALSNVPKSHLKTLTRDNGSENLGWKELEDKLNIDVYFANPYHSWERGSNENTNGLIRRYLPKGTDFSKVSNEYIKKVESLLNNRPRKRLDYQTPSEIYYKLTGVAI